MAEPVLKVLLVGSLPPPLGGARVLFQCLLDELAERDDVVVRVVDTGRVRGCVAWRGPALLWRLMGEIRNADVVSAHLSTSALPLFGPVLRTLTRLAGKPLIVRKFGGTDYRGFGWIRRNLIRAAVRRFDLFLVETKALIRAVREDGVARVEWFPNHRPMDVARALPPREVSACRRFVFLSQVRPVKGVGELIAAGERFGADVTVDVYGPFFDGLSESTFAGLKRVRYCGVVQPEEVLGTLRRYDALVLPTYHSGEGYPGIVLEAYGAGLPVIATHWRAVPEIVDDTCGLLIEPRSAEALHAAMERLVRDDALYARLCAGARRQRDFFDVRTWAEHFVGYCRELYAG
ncbi:MAG: glycosyltransferase family 4 protein [Planctomycetes bacterium]|nr:glycosyltransferase family 4 protein [Planctomycetota bacterium]